MAMHEVSNRRSCSCLRRREIAVLGVVGLIFLADCRTSMHAKLADAGGTGTDGGAGTRDASPVTDARVGPEASTPVDRPLDASPSGLADAAVDLAATSACSMPNEGAPCTSDEVPCATCCTDHWSCSNGTWQNLWLGCLPTTFTCGDQACTETGDYCEADLHFGGLPLPTTYVCQTLPAACKGQRCPTCACLEQAGISFSSCEASATGAIYVTR
jgi:hypothetical protein